MPTTVTHSIGTSSRDYSTLQLWEDACPANLVTADQIWRGEAYNDSEFTGGAVTILAISGETTDSTRYLELTCATGQSFQDNANVRTNALTYNQANGVGLRITANFGACIAISTPYTRISRIQVKNDFLYGLGNHGGIYCNGAPSGVIIKDTLQYLKTEHATPNAFIYGSGSLAINCIVFKSGSGSGIAMRIGNGGKAIGCTVVRTTDQTAGGTGFGSQYSNNILQSCASFGFTTCASGSGWDTTNSKNNATDQASGFPGSTANQYGVTFNATTPFTQAGVTGLDLRSIAATTLAGNGFLDATNAPNDISGYARPANPTIGHWQIATTSAVQQRLSLMGVGS